MSLFAITPPTPTQLLNAQAALFTEEQLYLRVLSVLEDAVVVLNINREILHANDRFVALTGRWSREKVLGSRLGEALGCWRADVAEGGCGTTTFCQECGAAQAIFAALEQGRSSRECRILNEATHTAFELRVSIQSLTINDQRFLVVILKDITDEKRRSLLERIFLHDIANTLSSLSLATHLLKVEGLEEQHALLDGIVKRLLNEVKAQRILQSAERGELTPKLEMIDLTTTLEDSVELNRHRTEKANQKLRIAPNEEGSITLTTDETLLARVLDNMLKNAIEASPTGTTITIGTAITDEAIEIWVHNPGAMTGKTSAQVFQRSFSTKGKGRGLGTYSMKLLGERYLGGRVGFTSSPAEGTRFFIRFGVDQVHASNKL